MSTVRRLMRIDVNATEFSHQTRRVKLEKQCEIRFEVHQISPLKLRLLDGRVEIFGYELPPNVWITFPPLMKFAVCSNNQSFCLVLVMFLEFLSNLG